MSIRPPRATLTASPVSDLAELFESAIQEAKRRQHVYVETEHLLAVLLRNPGAQDQLRFWSVNASAVEFDLRQHLERLPSMASRHASPHTSAAFLRVFAQVASNPCRMNMTGAMLISALLQEPNTRSIAILRKNGLEVLPPLQGASEDVDRSDVSLSEALEKLAHLARALSDERRAAVSKAIGAFMQTPGSDCLKHALFSMLKTTASSDAHSPEPRRATKPRSTPARTQCA